MAATFWQAYETLLHFTIEFDSEVEKKCCLFTQYFLIIVWDRYSFLLQIHIVILIPKRYLALDDWYLWIVASLPFSNSIDSNSIKLQTPWKFHRFYKSGKYYFNISNPKHIHPTSEILAVLELTFLSLGGGVVVRISPQGICKRHQEGQKQME